MNSADYRRVRRDDDHDRMRVFILLLAILAAVAGLGWYLWGQETSLGSSSLMKVAPEGLARLAVVLGAVWLAWPVVRKPAMWLPPGILLVSLAIFAVCVVQPRAAIALLPLLGVLLGFSAMVRFFRGQNR